MKKLRTQQAPAMACLLTTSARCNEICVISVDRPGKFTIHEPILSVMDIAPY
jgi:hypothetical protein